MKCDIEERFKYYAVSRWINIRKKELNKPMLGEGEVN
jgi:hypothetical protein